MLLNTIGVLYKNPVMFELSLFFISPKDAKKLSSDFASLREIFTS